MPSTKCFVSSRSYIIIFIYSIFESEKKATPTQVIYGRMGFKWKIEYEKSVICQNFDRKGWTRTEGDDWNIFWATVGTVKQIFNPDSGQVSVSFRSAAS